MTNITKCLLIFNFLSLGTSYGQSIHLNRSSGLSSDKFNSFYSTSSQFNCVANLEYVHLFDSWESSKLIEAPCYPIQSDFYIEGNYIWSSCYNGLFRINRNTNHIENYTLEFENKDTVFSGFHLIHAHEIRDELYFIANSSLYKFNTKSRRVTELLRTKGRRFIVNSDNEKIEFIIALPWLNANGIECIKEEESGYYKSVKLLDKVNWKDSVYSPMFTNGLIKDSSIWLTSDIGLVELSLQSFDFIGLYRNRNSNDFIDLVNFQNELIVSTRSNKLLCFDIGLKEFVSTNYISRINEKLISNQLGDLNISDNRILWVTEINDGVLVYDLGRNSQSLPCTDLDMIYSFNEKTRIIIDDDEMLCVNNI